MKMENSSKNITNNSDSIDTSDSINTSEKDIIRKLENEGMIKVEELYKDIKLYKNNNFTYDKLINIIKDGTSEFEKKTGRSMTYSEMRETYG